jgi:hypothetical protein
VASSSPRKASTAEPKPHQPGSATRHWPQEKLQGMARRSSIECVWPCVPPAAADVEPAISRIGVAAKK